MLLRRRSFLAAELKRRAGLSPARPSLIRWRASEAAEAEILNAAVAEREAGEAVRTAIVAVVAVAVAVDEAADPVAVAADPLDRVDPRCTAADPLRLGAAGVHRIGVIRPIRVVAVAIGPVAASGRGDSGDAAEYRDAGDDPSGTVVVAIIGPVAVILRVGRARDA